jgi:hypothetical protein
MDGKLPWILAHIVMMGQIAANDNIINNKTIII